MNTFMLTTDGRVFGWGDNPYMLGKEQNDEEKQGGGNDDGSMQGQSQSNTMAGLEEGSESNLTEISFANKRGKALIIAIATGRNHALALDSQGNVYSWGNNKFG